MRYVIMLLILLIITYPAININSMNAGKRFASITLYRGI